MHGVTVHTKCLGLTLHAGCMHGHTQIIFLWPIGSENIYYCIIVLSLHLTINRMIISPSGIHPGQLVF